ncbi:MAG TPA: adenylyltransferase/cytidyltransferase family protein [Acidobacteriota bacterium]|nr:adenylyltransferase/cytidyltransferase family protein [Acidobacteriota bacterium]
MTLDPQAKIKTLAELSEVVRLARTAGKRVILTNGCFDLIHVGHIRYLQEAKALGGILIVAINSDDSVATLKGAGRPLQSESERAEILASLECVDCVAVFDTPTVDPLLLQLRPDVHAKGTDYTTESVPERNTVLSYGGRVAIVGDPKDHSTRDLIKSILTASVPCARRKKS